jgi:hypothetical protein
MINLKGRTGETRIATVSLIASFVVLVLQLQDNCDGVEPIWVLLVSGFVFTFAFIWLLVLFYESRGIDRAMAVVYGVTTNFAIGFGAWGLAEAFLDHGTPDRSAMHQSFVWIPCWIVGVLLGTDFVNVCPD